MRPRQAYGFYEMLEVGEQGYYEVAMTLLTEEVTLDVKNLQDEPKYQEKDIDFLWKYKDSEGNKYEKMCELKTDRIAHKTGNMFLETVSCMERGTKGNILYTECDILVYYLIATKKIFMINMSKLREWLRNNKEKLETRTAKSKISGTKTYQSKGYIVPIGEIIKDIREHMVIINSKY